MQLYHFIIYTLQCTLKVNYAAIVPILVEVLKEQQSIIDNQNTLIDNQKSKIDALEKDIANIKKKLGL